MEEFFLFRYWKLGIAAAVMSITALVVFSVGEKRFSPISIEEPVYGDQGVYTLSRSNLTLEKNTNDTVIMFYKNAEKGSSIVLDWTDKWKSDKNTISLDNIKKHYSVVLSQVNLAPSDVRRMDTYTYSQFPNPGNVYRSHQNDSQNSESGEGTMYESGFFYRDFYGVESFPNKWKLLFRIKQFSPSFVPLYKLSDEVVAIENGLKMGKRYKFLVETNEDVNAVVLITQEIDISSAKLFEWQNISKNVSLNKDFSIDFAGRYYLYCIFGHGEPDNDLLQKFTQSEIIKELVNHLSKADIQREFLAVPLKENKAFSVYAAVLIVQ